MQLAVRGWQGRRSNGYTVSPVVVRLAGPEAARERESVLRRDTRGQASSSQLRDPCDKEVVMEALKQKRLVLPHYVFVSSQAVSMFAFA